MKAIMKGAIRDEKGYMMIMVLILLVVGGLVLTPLLGLMSTGLVSGQIYEKKMDEYYAADTGVEDAIWKIKNDLPASYPYFYPDPEEPPWLVNEKSVDVVIYQIDMDPTPCGENITYRILSIARDTDGSGTQIEAHIVNTITYSSMLDHLVTVKENLDDKEIDALEADLDKLDVPCPESCTECDKCRKVYDYYSDDYQNIPQECKGCIAVYNFPDTGWPTVDDLSGRYWEDVKYETPYPSGTIDLNGVNMNLGPLYRNGTLEILNNNNQNTATFTLTGTLYITGDTRIGMDGKGTNKPNLTIELNGNTIFVASNSTGNGHEALKIGPWCTINGPGVIIAVGDIYFQPNGEAGANEEPAFVLSVMGTTSIQPGVNFLGAIAGKLDVNLQSGGKADVSYPEGGFGSVNFPSLFEAKRSYSIASWEISPV